MSEFVSSPAMFFVSWCPMQSSNYGPGVQLRWMIHPDRGMPRSPFTVWVRPDSSGYDLESLDMSSPLLVGNDWIGDFDGARMAFVALLVEAHPGKVFRLRGYQGRSGSGRLLDERTVTYYGEPIWVVLAANAIRSVRASGWGQVHAVSVVGLDQVINGDGWEKLETVGLPVDGSGWGSYPEDDQGFEFELMNPRDAALMRIERGMPIDGPPSKNAFYQNMPNWGAGDPGSYLEVIEQSLIPDLKQMLDNSAPPDDLDYRIEHEILAPESIHGDSLSGPAASNPRATLSPLAVCLAAAASDPLAALALGFGTFLPSDVLYNYFGDDAFNWIEGFDPETGGFSVDEEGLLLTGFAGRIMVTVDHQLVMDLPEPAPDVDTELSFADVILRPADGPPTPRSLSARHRRLDRPAAIDQPWLEAVEVAWERPEPGFKDGAWGRSYAIARNSSLLLTERNDGGYRTFVPARAEATPRPWLVTFTDGGAPASPGVTPSTTRYNVCASDWFGRWSEWASHDYERVVIQPLVPILQRAELIRLGDPAPIQAGELVVEFAWNWADRRPRTVIIEAKLYPDGGAVPLGKGSVKQIGVPASTAADYHVDLTVAPPVLTDTLSPIPEVVELPDEQPSEVKRYRARIPGFTLDFGSHSRINVQVRVCGEELIRPGVWSGWGDSYKTTVLSKLAPPRPAAPPGMLWTSLPDPKGIARARLTWAATPGTRYVIYGGDETALRRELAKLGTEPVFDPRAPIHERLVDLRGQEGPSLRRALRRVAEGVEGGEYELTLPKGTRLIHFYVVVAVSENEVESPFPSSTDDWFAVATPERAAPNAPRLRARSASGGIAVEIELPPGPVAPARVELSRSRNRIVVSDPDAMGPPRISVDLAALPPGWTHEDLGENGHRLSFIDGDTAEDWAAHWYRAAAWSADDATTGRLGARSEFSGAVQAARPAPTPPTLSDLSAVRPDPGGPILVRWSSDLPVAPSPLGTFGYAVIGTNVDGRVVKRASASEIKSFVGSVPEPADASPVFRHHSSDPDQLEYAAWIELSTEPVQIVVQATDPSGRSRSYMLEVPAP